MQEQQSSKTYHTLIHLGCGAKPKVEEYCEVADKVCLIDADSEVVGVLKESTESIDDVHVFHRLVGIEKREVFFYKYSLPWANGTTPLDATTQRLYPGLRCLDTTEQTTTPVDSLLAQCLPEHGDSGPCLLMLEVGCQNAELLQALDNSGLLGGLDITIVVIPAHRSAQTVAAALMSLQFSDAKPKGLTLPERSQVLTRHPLLNQLQRYKAQFEDRTEERDQLKSELDERQQQLQERTEQRDEKAKQVDNAVKAHQELEQQLETVTQERNQISEQVAQHLKALEQVTQQLNERDRQCQELVQQRDEKARQADGAAQSNNSLSTKLEELQHQAKHFESELASLRETHSQLQIDFREQQRSAQLAAKLSAKLEADASELRERYSQKVKSEQELKKLIKELHAKLQAASHFYHKLEQEYPELLEKL